METTHAYRTILKGGFLLCQAGMLLFFGMLRSDNFLGLLCAFAVLGLFMLPMLPAVVENCAECTYPAPEEVREGERERAQGGGIETGEDDRPGEGRSCLSYMRVPERLARGLSHRTRG